MPVFGVRASHRLTEEETPFYYMCVLSIVLLFVVTLCAFQSQISMLCTDQKKKKKTLCLRLPIYLWFHSGQDKFDFYLAVSEEDLEDFGLPFCRMVERQMNMRPCLTLRDIGPGYKYENMAEALETKYVYFFLNTMFIYYCRCRRCH